MATNVFPALDIPQPINPAEQMQRAVTLSNIMQERQQRQQQMEYEQQLQPLKLQEQQNALAIQNQQIKDQQISTTALQNSNGDPDAYLKGLRDGGVSWNTYSQVQKGLTDYGKAQADKKKTDLENEQVVFDHLSSQVTAAQQLAPTDPKRAQLLWDSAVTTAEQNKLVEPGQISHQMPGDPGGFDNALNMIGFHSKITENALKTAQTNEAAANAEYKRNENLAIQQYGGVAPQYLEAKYVALKQQQAQNIPISPQDQAFMRGYEANKLLVPQFKVENRQGPQGTMQLAEDAQGNPILFNTVTGQTQPAPGIAKPGTFQKNVAGPQAALNYAQTYVTGGKYTGPGDEALMEQYFELAKPTSGFRMSAPQMEMLKTAQSWQGTIEARLRHAATGVWFSDEQRQQISTSMTDLAKSKGIAMPGGGAAGGVAGAAGGGGQHDPMGIR
jgi:hypothetical protein